MSVPGINRELLLGFIDESVDGLSAVDDLFVRLETNPSDMNLINAIFRPIHSLKGNAAYFGLMRIKKLAHAMENVLDRVRKGQQPVNRFMIDTLLPGVDSLRKMLLASRDEKAEVSDEREFNALLGRIEAIAAGSAATDDRVVRIRESLDSIAMILPAETRETVDHLAAMLASVPALSALKTGQSGASTKTQTAEGLSKGAAKVFEALKNGGPFSKNAGKTAALADLIRGMREEAGIGDQKRIADEIADIFAVFSSADSGIDELAISTMSDKLNELRKKPEGPDSGTDGNKPSPPPVGKMPEVSGAKHEKTMRIPEQSLDDFLRCVGDLLSVEEQLRHVSRQIGAGNDVFLLSDNLKDAIRQFESISKELRSKIMDVRKVEARVLLQKAGRIVRDISSQSGKKISVECIGEDLRIDKSYIDLLDAPLTHMLRNAADHGIELPQTRSAAGKPETGTISVTLKENDDDLTFVVSDDGAGLDYEGLRKKAVGLGIVADTAQLSKSDIVELLFRSGITTAAVVTDVSGRGVGMDVVKRAIVEAGGRIDVSSTPGSGTAFTVSLPRNASTQIIDGYVVQSFSEESYVLPLGFVLEAFDFLPGDVSGVAGGRALMRRGSVYPLHDIDSLLGDRADRRCETADGCRKGVLLDVKGAKTVISVKEIIGIQKVVCKPVEGDLVEETIFDGAAISGTGKVFMIVNPEKLLKSG